MQRQHSILFLGGSAQQVPVIERAKKLGYRTVLIDYLKDNPGRLVADSWYCESTTDVNAVERIARNEYVSGIVAYASDPAALPAAMVCETLGLPTNPAASIEVLSNKAKFRQFLKKNNFGCPDFIAFDHKSIGSDVHNQISKMRFPVLIKPTDSSGSKGVLQINSLNDVRSAIAESSRWSRNGVLIIEEYVERGYPHLIGGDVVVSNGKIVLFGLMDCLRSGDGNKLVPLGKMHPVSISSVQRRKLTNELQRVVSLLNLRNGEFNIEVIIGSDDIPYIIEFGARAGGNMIPILLSDIYKTELLDANISFALGDVVHFSTTAPNDCYMSYVVHSESTGIFESVQINDELKKYVYRTVLYKSAGDNVSAFCNAGDAVGIMFLKFPDRQIMERISRRIKTLVQVYLA